MKLTKLRTFYAYRNEIEVISRDFIMNNKQMKLINFQNNNLKIISADFTQMKNLEELDIYIKMSKYEGTFFPTVSFIQSIINAICTGQTEQAVL